MSESIIADEAQDGMAVTPPDPDRTADGAERVAHDPRQEAGQDTSIEARLEKNPESKEAKLDRALDESMDASDPPSSTQPVHSIDPPASTGYKPDAD